MAMNYLGLPLDEDILFERYGSLSTKILSEYYKIVSETPAGKDIFEQIASDPRVQALQGTSVFYGNSWQGFHAQRLAAWFVWYANRSGMESANLALNRFLNDNHVDVIQVLYVYGISDGDAIELDGGISIVPVEELPQSEAMLEIHIANREWSDFRNVSLPQAALVSHERVDKTQIFNAENPEKNIVLNCVTLYEAASAINVLDRASCRPALSTTIVGDDVPFGLFCEGGGSRPLTDTIGREAVRISGSDAWMINEALSSFRKKSNQEKEVWTAIFERLACAKQKRDIENRIMELGIALEMLLLRGNSESEQVSLPFRLRGSWLIGTDYHERKIIYEKLKNIYKARCKIAHGSRLDEGAKQKEQDEFDSYLKIAGSICRKLLHSEKPDWDKVILGG